MIVSALIVDDDPGVRNMLSSILDLQMLKEVEDAQKNNPFVKYQNPNSW